MAASGSEEMVRVRGSMTISFLGMPYWAAVSQIFLAMASRPSAVGGMPFSSRARPTTTPPYFFTRGKRAAMLSALPDTELSMGLPL